MLVRVRVCACKRASDSRSCKMMSSLIQRPKNAVSKQACQSLLPIGQGHTHTYTNTSDTHNSSMHICTQPFSSTHRHFASSLWQGQRPIRIGAGSLLSPRWLDSTALRVSLQTPNILFQLRISIQISAVASVPPLSAGPHCWSVLVFDDLFLSWPAQSALPAVTGGHWSTVFNETGLLAHYWSPMACKLISTSSYWFLITWKWCCFIMLGIIGGFCSQKDSFLGNVISFFGGKNH